ncbi:unnamed protein product [Rhizoctonia solani]|uniref:Protein kinase domain-containing protein n=1 Tax=Rhizoctonia solani TaxID=456999 RepID=A0A8H2XKR6_9AGAM|nr:unnamed protein product [Rhizoctonia solani]
MYAELSDFGTAQDALQSTRERSGNTGTLEYSAPESLRHNQDGSLRQITSKSDVWSLGMILHKLIYFRLPWKNDEDMAELEKEIIRFQGYKANAENMQVFEKRRLPAALCQLLSKMLAVEPGGRPGSDQVLKAIHGRQLDPSPDLGEASPHQGIGPLVRRPTPPSRGNESLAVSSDTNIDDSGALGQESSPHLPSVARTGRAASGTQARRRSDPVGEINDIAPRLLVLGGPVPAARRVAGLLSGINIPRILSRGFKSALLICKTILLINLCVPTSPKVAALSFVIGVGLLDMWTRRLRWSFALVVLHLVFMWTANREHHTLPPLSENVKLPVYSSACNMTDMEDSDDMELESLGTESMTQDSESIEPHLTQFFYEPPPDGVGYGGSRLDRMPANIIECICRWFGLREIIALRRTCKALDKAIANRPGIWTSLVHAYRRAGTVPLGRSPVVMPKVYHLTDFQEDILRCGFILRNKWHNPAFHARPAIKDVLRHPPYGISQIIFVPGAMGRYFLTVSRQSVILWTLEPDGVPHSCRPILTTNEMIVQALVSRPGLSLVAFLAVQITQQHTHRLRTEIHQLHLSCPDILFDSGFGLSAIHETEGALVAFVDYVLAYATNDTGQTILLCCWVSKLATKLATPVNEREIRWQHSSCRAVAIGTDIVVVVRDSTAEIYPRNEFAVVDFKLEPTFNPRAIQGALDMLPVTYATDTAIFPSTILGPPSIYIHKPQSISYANSDLTQTVRVISLVGVARSTVPPTDPSVPYFVVPSQLYRWTSTRSSRSTSPSHTAPPSPSHTTPSPTHTHASSHTPPSHSHLSLGLLPVEKYKFVFHVHALQHQHAHFSYGPAVTGPNGRAVMLATAINAGNGPNQPKQYVLKYRHPTYRELRRFLTERLNPTVSPGPHPITTSQTEGTPQPQPQPPQQAHIQLPPPPAHPLLNQHPTPRQEPHYGMLTPLTRPLPMLDVLRGMSSLWNTQDMLSYEMVAWDEGAGTVLVASRLGNVVVLECAKPASDPAGASSWHRS